MRVRERTGRIAMAVLVALSLAACVDTQRVLVDKPLFEQPPAAAQGFLGYSDVAAGKPVCGNCHVGHYAEWQGTAHSHAFKDLQASDHAAASCEGCHTVGAKGNWVTDPNVGWTSTADPRYQDVQCESCHGPGLTHVTNPDETQPLASVLVGLDLTNGCGECHSGANNPFLEEWSQSIHGQVPHQSFTGDRDPCKNCHTGEGALRSWGEDPNFLEKDSLEENGGHLAILCIVCHDPHNATIDKQLRFPIDVASVEGNLCMKCHHYRPEPEVNSSRGPMSPEGPLLLGQAGWRSPDFGPTDDIRPTHASSANEDLCVTCHLHRSRINDASGALVINSTGHLFVAIPCPDAEGRPTTEEGCTVQQRSFEACANSACHGSADNARFAYGAATQRIEDLVATVNALLAKVPASEFDTSDGRISTAEGAKFNAALGALPGSPIHNPFMMEALLTASVKQLQKDYGVTASASVSLDDLLPRRDR